MEIVESGGQSQTFSNWSTPSVGVQEERSINVFIFSSGTTLSVLDVFDCDAFPSFAV